MRRYASIAAWPGMRHTTDGIPFTSWPDRMCVLSWGCIANPCSPTEAPYSDKSATGSITGITGATVMVTCINGYSGGGIATCGAGGSFDTPTCTSGHLPTASQPLGLLSPDHLTCWFPVLTPFASWKDSDMWCCTLPHSLLAVYPAGPHWSTHFNCVNTQYPVSTSSPLLTATTSDCCTLTPLHF
jgi:hypothetical protein